MDNQSLEIGRYYQQRRHIPPTNVIQVSFRPGNTTLSREEFARIKAEVDARTPPSVQAYALTWAEPYRVDCMSLTTAFAAGFDERFCAKECQPTQRSPYFNSDSTAPYTDFGLRPTMALAARTLDEAKKLIDRGIAADATSPKGTGYLVSTTDKNRNVRAAVYPLILNRLGHLLELRRVNANYIENRNDVLFYFTGIKQVRALDTLRFRPGAIADHLTSTGGALTNSGDQMSALRWLEAGATGSYGAVVEPCNFPDKFPSPGVAISRYLRGETLIAVYWKSVAMPGQGIFIGEPLASPFARTANLGVQR